MVIKSAEFVISNTSYKNCPDTPLPEYAFIGRSNVGKSSLINMLVQKKDLAKTSSKPGKTLLINHFIVNNQWHLVDLPGYGYAKTSKTERNKLKDIVDGYIQFREQLYNLFVLIDSRLKPQSIDLDFFEFLGINGVPFSIVFTKTDKLSRTQRDKNIAHYKEKLLESWESLPPIFITSSQTGEGREELLNYIDKINDQMSTETK